MMGERDWIREGCCRSVDIFYYHRGNVADELRGSWFQDREWFQDDHEMVTSKEESAFKKKLSCTKRKTRAHGEASRMDDLRVFQGQRPRRVCLGPPWDLEGRMEEWQQTVVQYTMGWNHQRNEEAAKRGNSGEVFLSWGSTVRAPEAIAVAVHSRYCSKKVNRETTPDLKMFVRYLERKIVRSVSLLVKGNFKRPASGATAAKGKYNLVHFVCKMCFCFKSNESCHFPLKNGDLLKLVVDFLLERHIPKKKKTWKSSRTSSKKSYNKNGKL